MNAQRADSFPSPLAGEGGPRRRRGTGEGARNLTKAARQLRSRMTDAERKLWFALKDRRFDAFKFRRQVPVGPYIADFLCFQSRLILEVDGGQHNESARDAERDAWLAQNDFRVVRFWNNDVLQNLEGVLTKLAAELEAPPHPSSSLRSTPPSPARGEGKKEGTQ
jgi:very-short-patch-repair endonuclease